MKLQDGVCEYGITAAIHEDTWKLLSQIEPGTCHVQTLYVASDTDLLNTEPQMKLPSHSMTRNELRHSKHCNEN